MKGLACGQPSSLHSRGLWSQRVLFPVLHRVDVVQVATPFDTGGPSRIAELERRVTMTLEYCVVRPDKEHLAATGFIYAIRLIRRQDCDIDRLTHLHV